MNKRCSWIFSMVALAFLSGFFIFKPYFMSPEPSTNSQSTTVTDKLNKVSGQSSNDKTLLQPELVVAESLAHTQVETANSTSAPKEEEPARIAAVPENDRKIEAAVVNVETAAAENNLNNTAAVSRGIKPDNNYPKLSPVRGIFGQFYYRDTYGGRIEIDPGWVAENIVTIKLPGLNTQVQVHKAAQDYFIKAFEYIANGTAMVNGKEIPLLNLIHTMDGTFVTRHVNWNSSKGLSNHSWGIAIDINASDHFRYIDPSLEPHDPNLILWEKAFKPAGFSWGNSYADSMHYELKL